jgi:head-tail adaptor
VLGIGSHRTRIQIQNPTEAVDSQGAPYAAGWVDYVQVMAGVEGGEFNSSESANAPVAYGMQTATFVVRYHEQYAFNLRQRLVLDDGSIFAVRAIRFDQSRSWAYIDGEAGTSEGQP